MKIYRTMAALSEEPLDDWGIESPEVSTIVRGILEDLLWDFVNGVTPVVDFVQACTGLSAAWQEHALNALDVLLKLGIVGELTPFFIRLVWPEGAMILAGFYPDIYAYLAHSKEELVTLSREAKSLVGTLGVEGAYIEIARRTGLFGKVGQ